MIIISIIISGVGITIFYLNNKINKKDENVNVINKQLNSINKNILIIGNNHAIFPVVVFFDHELDLVVRRTSIRKDHPRLSK